jgi:hypothetical protein
MTKVCEQIFVGTKHEENMGTSDLLACVQSAQGDYGPDMTWKNDVVVEIFSALIEKQANLERHETRFEIVYPDAIGRPLLSETWCFSDEANYVPLTPLRSVTLKNGEVLHCYDLSVMNEDEEEKDYFFINREG